MGFWNSAKNIGLTALAPVTGGGSLALMDENTRSQIPVISELTGAKSDAEKQLLEKQKQMAEEARKQKIANEQARMNALGQQMLAFNPYNQTMAQMFGPEAAFTPQQFGQMAADPGAKSQDDFHKAWQQSIDNGTVDPRHRTRVGAPMQNFTADDLARMEADKRRQAMVAQSMQPLPRGPAPLRPVTPQAGRRY